MRSNTNPREKLLNKLDTEWTAFNESFAGLSDEELMVPGAMGDWSIKDIIAHISIWEEESLEHLPTIAQGGRPPKYASVGGIDAFNDQMIETKRSLSLAEVRRGAAETHARLIAYLQSVPVELLAGGSRFRRRLRLDTYGHYPLHAASIRAWRAER